MYSRASEPVGSFLCCVRHRNKENQTRVGLRVKEGFAWVSRIETARDKVSSGNIDKIIKAYQLTTKEIRYLKRIAGLKRVKSLTEEDLLFSRISSLPRKNRRSLVKRLISGNLI